MSLDSEIKEFWQKIQERYNYPVDSLGRPIDPKDEELFNVWVNEGIIDSFLRK